MVKCGNLERKVMGLAYHGVANVPCPDVEPWFCWTLVSAVPKSPTTEAPRQKGTVCPTLRPGAGEKGP
jgi:hypothetical protein